MMRGLEQRRDDGASVGLTGPVARLGAWIGSPLVLAACVLALVGGVGTLSTWLNYRVLRRAGEQRAQEILRARGEALRRELASVLATADTLLDRLTPHAQALPRAFAPLLETMHELAAARSAITWISASFPDGAFCGVSIEGERVRGQVSRADGVSHLAQHYEFDEMGRPREVHTVLDRYDPRARPFYRFAVARGITAWTAPYPFLPHLRPGISRVRAVFDGVRRDLRSVLTVDYDTSGLAPLLARPLGKHQRQLVLAADGSVLAASGVALPLGEALSEERALNWSDLDDLPLHAARARTTPRSSDRAQTVRVDGEDWRLEQTRVGSLDGAPIVLISMIPERELFARAHAQARNGLFMTGVLALVALALAAALSANIARLRERRVHAEMVAARALSEVAELGSYQLLQQIGGGGMGSVYRARHKLLAREAALKLIKADDGATGDEALRTALFFEEARVLASMRSIHTVAVYDFGVAHDGRYFLAMELLDGLDLEALVRIHGPQPPARVAAILAQACESLAEAHAAGLVHRDVKPANLFLCQLATWLDLVKVLDFGLTRTVGTGSTRNAVEGTPAFISPEQATGVAVEPRSDLYALGAVGFYLLSGQPPYPGRTATELMTAHVSASIPALPAAVVAQCPALAQIVTRCMAKRPEHRPRSAEALARALRQVATDNAETFTDAMRAAFWADRKRPSGAVAQESPMQPMISVSRRRMVG